MDESDSGAAANNAPPVDADRLARWLSLNGVLESDVDLEVRRFGGGNSNETYLVVADNARLVIRRPPRHGIDPTAHSMEREWRVLRALNDTAVPTPRVLAHCDDVSVIGASFLVMEYVDDSVSILDVLPPAYDVTPGALRTVGEEMVDALASLQAVEWRAVGLADFGRPEGFLERQVPRWQSQLRRYQVRDLPVFDDLAGWLQAHRPADQPPGIIHGDFHLDNCLFSSQEPRLLAVVDWEMATIGDPLLDLGLALAFWGERAIDPPAMPRVEAASRATGAPTRQELADRYAQRSGRDVSQLSWYCSLAFWKLAAVVEGAYAQHVRGQLATDYSAALEEDVPRMLDEAAAFAGLQGGSRA